MKPEIDIIVNKAWEAEPMLRAIADAAHTPADLGTIATPSEHEPGLRMTIDRPDVNVRIYCIEDAMPAASNKSSSEVKAGILPAMLDRPDAALVIAAGTAGTPHTGQNGDVVFGRNVWAHNSHPNGENPLSNYTSPNFDRVVGSSLDPSAFGVFDAAYKANVEANMHPVPNKSAPVPTVLANADFVDANKINVTDYKEYDAIQNGLLKTLHDTVKEPLGSMETTHFLIREAAGEKPFAFVSAIAAQIGDFDAVTPKQNEIASHNMGVALAWAIPGLAQHVVSHPPVAQGA